MCVDLHVTTLSEPYWGPPIQFATRQNPIMSAGVANPEMTFADMSEDPVPKRRKQSKARTAGKAAEEKKDVEAAAASTAGASRSGTAAGLEEAASEPAELTRTGAAEVAADADVSLVSPQG